MEQKHGPATTREEPGVDAFDHWCLRRILRIPCRARISNKKVRRRTDLPPFTRIIIQYPHHPP